MKLRDLFVEFKVNNEPRDEVHYRQLKKDLQKIQNDPKQRDPETKRAVMKRKAELDAWAHSKGIKSENSIEEGHYPHIKSFDKLYGINDVQKYKDMADDAQSMDMEEFVDTYNNSIDMAGDFWEDHQKKVAEDPMAVADLKRMKIDNKKLYVHKDGKTELIPVEKKDEYMAKGWSLSKLKSEDQVDERMPASIIKHKEKLANMTDKELADRFKDFDETRLRQMAWRHGYGKMSDYYVNRKNKGMSQDTNEGDMKMGRSAFVQMLANKIQEPQQGHGRPEYDNRLLAKMYKLVTGKDVDFEGDKFTIKMNTPTTEDLDYRSEDILNKAGFDPADIDTYMKVFNDHGDTSDVKQMNMKEKVGLADAMSIVLASHGISNESVNEDAPFGSGMDLVRLAVMRKFISAEEYTAYAEELKAAGEQVEQEYDDWPDGEGFGSSDGNFAIKDLMTTAGYEFDEQDTGGKFIVTKMPEKLEKMGIKNARMKDAVTTDEDADIDAQFKSDVLQFLNSKVVQIEKQIELQPANTAEEKENKEFALKLFDFVQAKLEQKDDADNTLTVPKSMIKKK